MRTRFHLCWIGVCLSFLSTGLAPLEAQTVSGEPPNSNAGTSDHPATGVQPEARPGVQPGTRPNILLLLVDDLKPALGCYGDQSAITPNLDGLAARGLRFEMAYCNQAVCAPSRFALLLGSHPTSSGLYGLNSQLREQLPSAVTLPQYFAQFGYNTQSLGKVFHIGHGNYGDAESWTEPIVSEKVIEYLAPDSTSGGQLTREEAYFTNQRLGEIKSLPRGAAFECVEVDDEGYADGRIAQEAIRRLELAARHRKEHGTPFLMAVGMARPHLPFCCPAGYWQSINPEKLPVASLDSPPDGAPPVASKQNRELSNYSPINDDGHPTAEQSRMLVHGYYASVSYADAQIGKILKALRDFELESNTIVVLWGDHGFHLGDHGYWTKHTNYEQANRIPLIIAAPGVTQPGSVTLQLAESVDLFPTLSELAGLPFPKVPQPIDGLSLMPVLRNPEARVRDHAFHCFPNRRLGRAIRTERYRLVEWKTVAEPASAAAIELYDYKIDPQESRNLAADLPAVTTELRNILGRYQPAVAPGTKPVSSQKSVSEKINETIPGRWTAERANNWYRSRPWPVGANFVPSTAINQLEMWQADTFDPETIDRELGWAASIGMNSMRVFLHDLVWRTDPEGFFRRVDQYLEIADRHKISTMFVIFDGVWHPVPKAGRQPDPRPGLHNSGWVQSPGRFYLETSDRQDQLKPYVQAVLSRYRDDHRIIAWDLFNEPDNAVDNSYGQRGTKEELPPEQKAARAEELLRKTFAWAREINPSQPLTCGVWVGDYLNRPTSIQKFSLDASDVISFHNYDNSSIASELADGLLKFGRPVLCTEFMARGNGSLFETVLPAFHERRVAAYNWGLVDGKSQTKFPWDSWEKPYSHEPSPWHHDVFHSDGRPYQQMEVDLIRSLTAPQLNRTAE